MLSVDKNADLGTDCFYRDEDDNDYEETKEYEDDNELDHECNAQEFKKPPNGREMGNREWRKQEPSSRQSPWTHATGQLPTTSRGLLVVNVFGWGFVFWQLDLCFLLEGCRFWAPGAGEVLAQACGLRVSGFCELELGRPRTCKPEDVEVTRPDATR